MKTYEERLEEAQCKYAGVTKIRENKWSSPSLEALKTRELVFAAFAAGAEFGQKNASVVSQEMMIENGEKLRKALGMEEMEKFPVPNMGEKLLAAVVNQIAAEAEEAAGIGSEQVSP